MSADTALEVGRLYAPLKTIADAFAFAQKDSFIHLPGLRGYWPMSAVNYLGRAVDHSNASVHLQRTGSPTYGFDGNAYIQLGVATDFLHTASSELDFTGTEAWIDPAIQGLTVGGWFMMDASSVVDRGLITKDITAPNRGFALLQKNTNQYGFFISGDGSGVSQVIGSTALVSQWQFVVGRFTPSTEVAVFVDGNKASLTTSVPAQCTVSTQNFEVGRYLANNSQIVHGKARDLFICAAALSDSLIEEVYKASTP
jgi:hypothetical protein